MKLSSIAILSAALLASPALAQSADAPGQDRVCLITWSSAEDAASGADASALSGKYLPRKAAEAQAQASGGTARVFDYSDQTVTGTTGTFVIGSNDDERSFCEGPEFNHDTTATAPDEDETPADDDGAGGGSGQGNAQGNPHDDGQTGNPHQDGETGNPHQDASSGNPGVGNPGNDKPVGNAGENPGGGNAGGANN